MPVNLDWPHVALRLFLTVVAGVVIGFNRGARGRPAGMRTTLLVCLAASLSMIQANLLMNTAGRAADSFVTIDLMRFPLGILSGMGFIGAGAILRKDNLVLGLTTAATLWFTTVMGLCFGGGQLGLGMAALALGCGTLWGLKYVEKAIHQDSHATLTVSVLKNGPSEEQLREKIVQGGCVIISWAITYTDRGQNRQIRTEVERRVFPSDTRPPDFLAQLGLEAGVEAIQWMPQGISPDVHQSDPLALPVNMIGPDAI